MELIISDDGSKDDTVSVCKSWLSENSSRFVRVELITVPQNTGTSANINRAVKVCRGVFLKSIAGDDLLEPDCIQTNLDGIGDAYYAVSDMIYFDGDKELGKTSNSDILYALAHLPSKQRLKLYCRTMMFINPPSNFRRMSLFEKIGTFDEESKILEDVPFFVKLFKSDVKIAYINKVTVRYRSGGVSHSSESRLKLQKLLIEAYNNYCRQNLTIWNPIDALTIVDFFFWEMAVKSKNGVFLKAYMSRYNVLHSFKDLLIGRLARRSAKN